MPQDSIDLDRSRTVTLHQIARKPAPMLVPDRLTVRMTVKRCRGALNPLRIKSLEGSLMIEWESLSRSIEVYRGLSKSRPNALIRRANVCLDLSRSIAGMPFNLTANLMV